MRSFILFLVVLFTCPLAFSASKEGVGHISVYYSSMSDDYEGRTGINVVIDGIEKEYLISGFTYSDEIEAGKHSIKVSNEDYSSKFIEFEVANKSGIYFIIKNGEFLLTTPKEFSSLKYRSLTNESSEPNVFVQILLMPFALVGYLLFGD